MTTLTVSATTDFSADTFSPMITSIDFTGDAATATFSAIQFDDSNISITLTIDGAGSGFAETIEILNIGAVFSAASWTFTNWGPVSGSPGLSDVLVLHGTAAINTITGSSFSDVILGGGEADFLFGGSGDDTFKLAEDDFVAGEFISGGDDSDTVELLTADGSIDFTFGNLTGVEKFVSGTGSETVIFDKNQFFGLTQIDMGSGTADQFEVSVSGEQDLRLMGSPSIAGAEFRVLKGGDGNDKVFLSAAQAQSTFNQFKLGTGNNTLMFSGDSLNFSGHADADIAGVNILSAELVTADAITIDVSGQSEGFRIELGVSILQSSVTGGVGADQIFSGVSDDDVDGGAGGDQFRTGSGDDTVHGGTGADSYLDEAGADFFDGGDDDDFLSFGGVTEGDTFEGGSGNDTIDLTAAILQSGQVIDLTDMWSGGTGSIGAATLSGFELLFSRDLTGGSLDDSITIGDGYAITPGLIFRISGGLGNDTLGGSASDDELLGESGNDTLSAFSGGDGLYGGSGSDVLFGGDGIDILDGGDDSDTAFGGAGNDRFFITAGADVLDGEGDDDTFELDFLTRTTTIIGGAGVDQVNINRLQLFNPAGVTVDLSAVRGGGTGTLGSNTVSGIENFGVGAGINSITLEGGDDIFLLGDLHIPFRFNQNTFTISGGAGNDTLMGTGFADVLFGGAGNDTLFGSNVVAALGPDGLSGDEGDDTLHGGSQDTFMEGGADNDLIILSEALNQNIFVITNGGDGLDTLRFASAVAGTTLVLHSNFKNIETVVISDQSGVTTGTTALHIDASAQAAGMTLVGNDGQNIIIGTGGSDTITAGNGDDVITGGAGGDTITGGLGLDTASYASSAEGVTVDLELGSGTGGDAAGDVLSGIEHVVGSGQGDTLIGRSQAQTLDGGAGDDTLVGGSGADALIGGDGIDTSDYSASGGRVTVNLITGIGAGAHAAGDVLTLIERVVGTAFNDKITGSDASDTIEGGAGVDLIIARGGDDILFGGDAADDLQGALGIDTMTGGLGNDTFIYNSLGGGGDTITDFSFAAGNNDRFEFRGSVFGGLAAGAIAANQWQSGISNVALTADVRFFFETDTGMLRFDSNGSVAGGITLIATLQAGATMNINDILIA